MSVEHRRGRRERGLQRRNFWSRWGIFNLVGGLGAVLQIGCLAFLHSAIGIHYLTATVLAVEATILHNFWWHERWTWRDRTQGHRSEVWVRLRQFNLTTGLVSIASNVLLMGLLVGRFGIHYVEANVLAIASGAAVNYLVGDFVVFRGAGSWSGNKMTERVER